MTGRDALSHTGKLRVLILATAVGNAGGVERAGRSLVDACSSAFGQENVATVCVWGDAHGTEPDQVFGRVSMLRRLGFVLRSLIEARRCIGRDARIIAAHPSTAPMAWVISRVTRRPYVVIPHGIEVWGDLRPSIRFTLPRAAELWPVSRFTRDVLKSKLGEGVNLRVIHHPLPTALSADLGAVRPRRIRGRVLTVARLTRRNAYKGVDQLISAWPTVVSEHPEASLVVVGDGNHRSALEDLAREKGVSEQVEFVGRVSDDQLIRAYGEASLFAMPARQSMGSRPEGEGFGLVFLEAGAACLPSLAGRAGGSQEVVRDGETGVLVDPDDVHDIASKICDLLTDPEALARLGENARLIVSRDFSASAYRERVSVALSMLR